MAARIALALLLAVGPIFVVLALFEGTRGLFTRLAQGADDDGTGAAFRCAGRVDHARTRRADPRRAGGGAGADSDQQAAMAFFLVGAGGIWR